jgi:HTH-type transcriptional regulator / antitoxin HigA
MDYKILRTKSEHQAAVQEAERLISLDPAPKSAEGTRLELLALLIEDYERRSFDFGALDPVDVIEFKMAETGLRQKDLVPLLGSRSRVSEVLARKRPLTVQMIRALSSGLGISADALIGRDGAAVEPAPPSLDSIDWGHFPYTEMEKRGWFGAAKVSGLTTEERLRSFLTQVMPQSAPATQLFRRKFLGEKLNQKAYYSTLAWSARVLIRAQAVDSKLAKFDSSKLNLETLRDLGRLSWFNDGPRLAVEFLSKFGIVLIIEPRLSNAIFDGAAMMSERGIPVVGLTLRLDRVDYFWFTLMHEVAHVWKHLSSPQESFVDRIESMNAIEKADAMEIEADKIARDSFVKRAVWERASARLAPTKQSIQELADSLHIHPGIVAGRIQFETGKYELFREFLGQGSIRKQFV